MFVHLYFYPATYTLPIVIPSDVNTSYASDDRSNSPCPSWPWQKYVIYQSYRFKYSPAAFQANCLPLFTAHWTLFNTVSVPFWPCPTFTNQTVPRIIPANTTIRIIDITIEYTNRDAVVRTVIEMYRTMRRTSNEAISGWEDSNERRVGKTYASLSAIPCVYVFPATFAETDFTKSMTFWRSFEDMVMGWTRKKLLVFCIYGMELAEAGGADCGQLYCRFHFK